MEPLNKLNVPHNKLTGVDVGHVEEVLRSRGYALVEERARNALVRKTEALINVDQPHGNMQYDRGYIHGLRFALNLPLQMIAEVRQRPDTMVSKGE